MGGAQPINAIVRVPMTQVHVCWQKLQEWCPKYLGHVHIEGIPESALYILDRHRRVKLMTTWDEFIPRREQIIMLIIELALIME